MRGRFSFISLLTAGAVAGSLLSGGCTVSSRQVLTTVGILPDVSIEDLFPADRDVSGYRRIGSLTMADRRLFEESLGRERTAELYGWRFYDARARRYGLPAREARIQVILAEYEAAERSYGALTHIRPAGIPEGDCFTLGMAGFLFDRSVVFAQANYMAVLTDLSPGPSTRPTLLEFARVLSRRMPAGTGLPVEAAALPIRNRVPQSDTYVRDSLFGFRGVDGGARARYLADGRESTAFAVRRDTQDGATRLLDRFRELCGREGPVLPFPAGEEAFRGTWKGRPFAAGRTDVGVYGVEGEVVEDELKSMLAESDRVFRARVPKKEPKPKPPDEGKEKEEKKGRGPFSLGF